MKKRYVGWYSAANFQRGSFQDTYYWQNGNLVFHHKFNKNGDTLLIANYTNGGKSGYFLKIDDSGKRMEIWDAGFESVKIKTLY